MQPPGVIFVVEKELVQTYYRGDIYKYVVRLKVDKENKAQRWIYLR